MFALLVMMKAFARVQKSSYNDEITAFMSVMLIAATFHATIYSKYDAINVARLI